MSGNSVDGEVEVEGVTVPIDHYIDGRRVSSETTFEVRSPIDWDNWKLAEVANGGQAEVDAAVAAGVAAVSTPWNAPVHARDLARRAGARGRRHGRAEAARVGAADVLAARRPR
jgi:aminomuconate-semialdehyde/2-hydroxymuconate-6-semialdehyde dehydrogenase